jgi:hypothetical protein
MNNHGPRSQISSPRLSRLGARSGPAPEANYGLGLWDH